MTNSKKITDPCVLGSYSNIERKTPPSMHIQFGLVVRSTPLVTQGTTQTDALVAQGFRTVCTSTVQQKAMLRKHAYFQTSLPLLRIGA